MGKETYPSATETQIIFSFYFSFPCSSFPDAGARRRPSGSDPSCSPRAAKGTFGSGAGRGDLTRRSTLRRGRAPLEEVGEMCKCYLNASSPPSSAPASSSRVPESGFALQPAPQANAGTQDRSIAQPLLLLAEILSTNTVLEFSPRFPTFSTGWAPRVSSQQHCRARAARSSPDCALTFLTYLSLTPCHPSAVTQGFGHHPTDLNKVSICPRRQLALGTAVKQPPLLHPLCSRSQLINPRA